MDPKVNYQHVPNSSIGEFWIAQVVQGGLPPNAKADINAAYTFERADSSIGGSGYNGTKDPVDSNGEVSFNIYVEQLGGRLVAPVDVHEEILIDTVLSGPKTAGALKST